MLRNRYNYSISDHNNNNNNKVAELSFPPK
jgi:hypothetical protein